MSEAATNAHLEGARALRSWAQELKAERLGRDLRRLVVLVASVTANPCGGAGGDDGRP